MRWTLAFHIRLQHTHNFELRLSEWHKIANNNKKIIKQCPSTLHVIYTWICSNKRQAPQKSKQFKVSIIDKRVGGKSFCNIHINSCGLQYKKLTLTSLMINQCVPHKMCRCSQECFIVESNQWEESCLYITCRHRGRLCASHHFTCHGNTFIGKMNYTKSCAPH